MPGATTTRPSGLSRSLATLAMNFEVPMPDRRGQPAGHLVHPRRAAPRRTRSPSAPRGRAGRPRARSTNASSSESGSTSGETSRSSAHHRVAGVAVGVEPAGEERRVRAPRPGLAGRHRRADAVLPGLVRRGRHHAAAADAADDDRLAAQRRLVALLDRGEERVQVEVEHRRVRSRMARNVPRRHRRARPATTVHRPGRRGRSPQAAPRRRARSSARPGSVPVMTTTRPPSTARTPRGPARRGARRPRLRARPTRW